MRIKDYIIFFMKTFGVLESLCIFAPLLTKSASDLNLNEQQMRFVRKELRKKFWRGGRVVDCGGLENRCTARYPGFESLSLRRTPKTKRGQSMTNPVKSRFYGIFYFSSRTSEIHRKALFRQSTVTKSLLKIDG